MKLFKILVPIALAFIVLSAFSLKKDKKEKVVYAYGVSASFTDTVVYFTNIQVLDSVKLGKNGFLPQKTQYSYQLKNYLEYKKRETNRTCMVYFSGNLKKLEKERNKLLAKYKKNKAVRLEQLTPEEFVFTKPEEE